MQFKSVPVGAAFMKGQRMFIKNCDFPKLEFGKATEILCDNPRRYSFHNTAEVTRIVVKELLN